MAGHSKWANIKFRKAGQDKKRGALFTKLIREISIAAKTAGGDPGTNPRLRTAIDKALAGNMTRDAINRAIKRAIGDGDAEDLEEIRYEGYGPNGVAFIVECVTNNRNRTVSEVRHALTKAGGNLGTENSVSYMFSKTGQILLGADSNEDEVMELVLEHGAEDVESADDGSIMVKTMPEDFHQVKDALTNKNMCIDYAEIVMLAENNITLDSDSKDKIIKLIDTLEDLDDVQRYILMLILGIDPGSVVTGFGIIRQVKKQQQYITSGCIRVNKLDWTLRLQRIFHDLNEVIANYQPDVAAIEQVFMYKNANSALKLGHARGVAVLAATSNNLTVNEYSPRKIKQAVVGYGNADKEQVQHMLKSMFHLNDIPQADAADALAVAVCHANSIHNFMVAR